MRSSSTDRAITSGLAFLSGVFPDYPDQVTTEQFVPGGRQVVPIYNPEPDEEDWLIRGYTKCQQHRDNLATW